MLRIVFWLVALLASVVDSRLLGHKAFIDDSSRLKPGRLKNSQLHPVQEFSNNLIVMFQKESTSQGTFVLLHGCGHSALDWFELPEEKRITQAVLKRGFAALVPNAPHRVGGCWHEHEDGMLLFQAVQLWLQKHGMEGKPLYAIGISSGGVMIARLVTGFQMPFKGMHFIVSPGAAIANPPSAGGFGITKFPRSTFVYMPKDTFAPPQTIEVAVDALKRAGTPVKAFKAGPKQVNTLYLRAPKMDISRKMMKKCIRKLYEWGYLESRCWNCPPGIVHRFDYRLWLKYGTSDYSLNYLLADSEVGPYLRAKLSRRRAIEEELHVIEGFHGGTAQHIDKALDFLLEKTKSKPIRKRLSKRRRMGRRHRTLLEMSKGRNELEDSASKTQIQNGPWNAL